MLRNFVFYAFVLGSCTYMGMKTQIEGPFVGSSCWVTCVAAAGSEVFSCAFSVRQRAKDELFLLAVVLQQSI